MFATIYRYGYSLKKAVWFFTRPSVAGSTCAVIANGQVLLVRQTYADREVWQLPGGGIHGWESADQALRRELVEEVALQVTHLTKIGEFKIKDDFRLVHLHCFAARPQSTAVTPDHREISEARWFNTGQLPRPLRWGTEELVAKAVAALS